MQQAKPYIGQQSTQSMQYLRGFKNNPRLEPLDSKSPEIIPRIRPLPMLQSPNANMQPHIDERISPLKQSAFANNQHLYTLSNPKRIYDVPELRKLAPKDAGEYSMMTKGSIPMFKGLREERTDLYALSSSIVEKSMANAGKKSRSSEHRPLPPLLKNQPAYQSTKLPGDQQFLPERGGFAKDLPPNTVQQQEDDMKTKKKKHVEEICFEELTTMLLLDKKYRYIYEQYVSYLNNDNDVLYLANNFPAFYKACIDDLREKGGGFMGQRRSLKSNSSTMSKNSDDFGLDSGLFQNVGSRLMSGYDADMPKGDMFPPRKSTNSSNFSSKYSYNSNTSKYTEFIDRKSINFPIITYESFMDHLNDDREPMQFIESNVKRSGIAHATSSSPTLRRGGGGYNHVTRLNEGKVLRVFIRVNRAEMEAGFIKFRLYFDESNRSNCGFVDVLYIQHIYRKLKNTKENMYRNCLVHLFETYALQKCFIRVLSAHESHIRFLMKFGFKLEKAVKTVSETLENDDKIFVLRRDDILAKYMYDIVEEGVPSVVDHVVTGGGDAKTVPRRGKRAQL